MVTKKTGIAVLATAVAAGLLMGAVVAQGPPENPGPSENVTENVTTGPPEGVAGFVNTSTLGPGEVDPNSLSGVVRVESQYVDNTTVELVRDTETNTSFDITVTGNATNVTFYVQQQAVEASQDIDNLTVAIDGENVDFGVADNAGGNWIGFEIDHFSTRTVTFASEGPPENLPAANPFGDANGEPLSKGEAADLVFDWNQDGEVNGTPYTEGEMADFLFEWNTASD